MGTNELILQKVQAGLESTRGTGVAATRKVYAKTTFSYERPLAAFADTTGTYSARRRVAYGRERVGFSATDIATYEDLAWWMQLAVKGGVTGTSGTGTPTPYTYAFTPSLSTDDLKAMTLEFNESGNPYESTQVMVNSWTLRGDADNDNEPGWMLDVEMLGRDWNTTTFTGSISDRDTEVIMARGTKIYVDDSTIGSTQVTGKLISFSVTGNNNIHYKAFAEDESGYAANKVGRGERTFDAQFVMEFDSDTEFAKFRNATPQQRLVRLEREGTVINGSIKNRARIDMAGYWSAISWADREGNITATFSMSCYYDSTLGYDLKVEVVNDLSTLA